MAKISKIADIPALKKQTDDLVQMARTIATEFSKTAASMGGAIPAIKAGSTKDALKSLDDLKEKEEELRQYQERLTNATEEYKQSLFKLNVAQQQAQFEKRKLAQQAKEEAILTSKISSEYDKLQVKLNQATRNVQELTLKYGANSKEVQRAVAEQQKLDTQIKSLDETTGKHQRNVGNYVGALKQMGTQFLAVAGLTGGFAMVMKGVQSVIASTDATSDKFKETLSGIGGATSYLARALANLDFTNLLQGMSNAYKEGARYEKEKDLLGNLNRALQVQRTEIDNEIIKQRTIAKNKKLEVEVRQKAVDEVVRLEQLKLTKTKEFAEKELQNELQNASAISGMSKEQVKTFVANYDELRDKQIDYGNSLIKVRDQYKLVASSNDAGLQGAARRMKAMKDLEDWENKLTYAQKRAIEVAEQSNKLSDEEGGSRERVANSIKLVNDANQEYLQSEEKMQRIRNGLNREAGLEEKKAANTRKSTHENIKLSQSIRQVADSYGELMISMGFQPDQVAGLQKDIAQSRLENEKEVTDQSLKLRHNYIDQVEQLNKKQISDQQKYEDDIKAMYDNLQNLAIETLGTGVADQISASFENTIGKMNSQLEAWHEARLKEIEDRKEKGIITDKQYQAEKEQLDKEYQAKQKANRIKEAKIKKQEALWEIAINTAVAFSKSLTKDPTGILGLYDLAQGAAQAAIVIARPIPQYAKGRKGGPGEFAIVGEQGTEAIVSQGRVTLTPDSASLTYLPSGADVVSHIDLQRAIELREKGKHGLTQNLTFKNEADRIIQAIENKKEVSISIDNDGLRAFVKNGSRRQRYLDQNIRL